MARGRFINKTVATDNKVAVLTEVYGPWATLFHHRIIAFLDVNGNMRADPFWLKANLFPIDDGVSPDDCRNFSDHLTAVGLAVSYVVDNIRYLHFPNFLKNQHGLRKDKERPEYPEYNQDDAKQTDNRRTIDGQQTDNSRHLSDQSAGISLSVSLSQSQSLPPTPPTPPEGSTTLDTAGGGGGEDFCSVGAEVNKIVGAWSNNGHNATVTALDVLQGRAPAPVEVKLDRTQDKAAYLAEKDAEVRRIAAEARERYRAEREAENKHLTQKHERDAVTWADEFAELVPKCTDHDKAEIYSAIKKIHNFEMLPTILQDVKNGVESGQFRNPKGIIIYRLKHAP